MSTLTPPRSVTGLVFNAQPRRNFWFAEENEPARSVIDERRHRQQRLAITFRLFARHGFDVGLAGHVTARDPELTDHFWVNPLGLHFSRIRVSDLLLVNSQGEIVIGRRPAEVREPGPRADRSRTRGTDLSLPKRVRCRPASAACRRRPPR